MSEAGRNRRRPPVARFSRKGTYDIAASEAGGESELEVEDVTLENVDAGGRTFTVDEAFEHIGFGKYQLVLSVFCGLIWMADSMEMMVLSILGPEARCTFGLKSWQEAFITTVVFVGMLAATFWGWFVDKYGRRRGMLVQLIFLTYFGFLSSLSITYGWLLFLRFLVGVGIGGAPNATVFYSEFLTMKSRAMAINLLNVWWAFGTFLEVGLAYAIIPTLGWRYLLAVSPVVFIFVFMMFQFVQQSPRHLVLRDETEKAREVLEKIARINGKSMPPGRLVNTKELDRPTSQSSVTESDFENSEREDENLVAVNTERAKISDLFSVNLRKTTLMTMVLWFVIAFTYFGVVLLTTEVQEIYHRIGKGSATTENTCVDYVGESTGGQCNRLTGEDYRRTLYTTLAEFAGTILVAIMCRFLTRKKALAVGYGAMAVFFAGTLLCQLSENVIIGMLFCARAFASAVFQVIFIYTPEVYPTSIRALGMAGCYSVARLGAIITPFIAQWFIRQTIMGAKIIYVVVSLIAVAISLLLPVETKGKPMHQTLATVK